MTWLKLSFARHAENMDEVEASSMDSDSRTPF